MKQHSHSLLKQASRICTMRLDLIQSTTDELKLIGALLRATPSLPPVDKKRPQRTPLPTAIDRFFHDSLTPISEINRMVQAVMPGQEAGNNPEYMSPPPAAHDEDRDENDWNDDEDEDNDPI